MLCKKCGAKIPDGASFCEKCGKPIQDIAKKRKKKGVIIGGCVGVLVLVVVTIGILFVTGMMGDKKDGVQANADILVSQESPSVTEEEVTGIEAEKKNEQESQETDADNARDKAWEAFEAYKADIEYEYKTIEQEYEETLEEEEDTTAVSLEDYKRVHGYNMIYLDEDDYPELIVYDSYMTSLAKNYIWTYKNGVITKMEDFMDISSYQERQGYFYHLQHGLSGLECTELISQMKGISVTEVITKEWESDGDSEEWEVFEKLDGYQILAEKAEIGSSTWIDITDFANTIDEAFTNLLEKNK